MDEEDQKKRFVLKKPCFFDMFRLEREREKEERGKVRKREKRFVKKTQFFLKVKRERKEREREKPRDLTCSNHANVTVLSSDRR